MKVFIDKKEAGSIAIARTIKAIESYSPKSIEFVDDPRASDLVIISVIGRLNQIRDRISYFGKPYVLFQFAFKSTLNPDAKDWLPLWKKAKLVWSYYDLKSGLDSENANSFNFYRSPLGVEGVFKRYAVGRDYIVATSGIGYLQEGVRECIFAADAVRSRVFHVGPVVTRRVNVDFADGMNDHELAKKYSACKFVSGLRRTEGFEFPVIEGLVCGARPICFDAPHYRHWFNDFAIFIPEESREKVIENLTEIFRSTNWPVKESEIVKVREIFNWKKIIEGFWERL